MPPAIAAAGIGALGSMAGGLFGAKRQNDQQQQQANQYNDYLNRTTAGQNKYLDYLNGLGPQTSNSTGTSYNNSNSSSSSTPTITSEFSPLVGMTRNILQQRLAGPSSLPQGYVQNQIRNINSTYSGAQQAASNQAARYGLSGPQAMAMATPFNTARAGEIANFQGSVPLTERSLQDQDINMASSLASIFGRGQDTNTHTSGSTSFNNSMTGPKPIAPMGAFLPPGPNMGGPVDPTANMIFGGLGAGGGQPLGTILSALFGGGNSGGTGPLFGETPPPDIGNLAALMGLH